MNEWGIDCVMYQTDIEGWIEFDRLLTEIRAICNVSEVEILKEIERSPFVTNQALELLRESALRGEWPKEGIKVTTTG